MLDIEFRQGYDVTETRMCDAEKPLILFGQPARDEELRLKRRAFSLIELLCVIGIISILVALYLGVFPKALGRAHKVSADVGAGQTNTLKMMEPGGLLDVP